MFGTVCADSMLFYTKIPKNNMMNFLKYTGIMILVLSAMSCKKDNTTNSTNETDGLTLVKTIFSGTHNINLYTETGKLQVGYNKVFLQIKNTDGSLVNNAQISWKPLMHMMGMQHACPYSAIGKAANKTSLYEGYIVFQMAGNDSEYWELSFDYNIGSTTYTANTKIGVTAAAKRNLESFMGTDGTRYIIALVVPTKPKVALNDMQAMVFKMQDMLTFPTVDGYTVKIDPRMPGMGNHGSPNNVHLTQSGADKTYNGKLSLTMTGYWKINLQLANAVGTVLKGEEITTANESSSIYFEVEF